MIETNKFKLGLFVTCAVLLFIIAVTCMGMFDFLNAKAYLFTTVTESVQGLNTGSQVKLRGVPIGKITNIIIHMEDKSISLEMEVDLKRFNKKSQHTFSGNAISQRAFYRLLHNEIRKGLRCRLEPDGITGLKYLEIDFFKDVKLASLDSQENDSQQKPETDGKYFYVPSTPSLLASLRLSMTDIIAKLAMIDFDGISKRTNLLLENMNRTLDPQKLDKLIANLDECVVSIRRTSNNLGSLVDKQEISRTLEEVQKAVRSLTLLSNDAHKKLDEAKIPETVAGLRDLTGKLEGSSRNMDITFQHVNNAIDALTELTQYLSDNPSALLYGKQKEKEGK